MPNSAVLVAAAGGGRTTPATPVLSHTSTGKFTITNYSSLNTYVFTLVSGSGTATLNTSTGVVTLSATNARFSVRARSTKQIDSSLGYCERKAYTYTDGGQTCTPNCGVVNGVNCFQGTGTCWCGTCAADGTICCGGCYGSTCVDNPDIKDNYTSSGYADQYGEWGKVT